MNNEDIFFETPITKTTTIVYNKFKIKDIKVSLNAGATIIVLVYPVDSITDSVICKNLSMTTEEYNLWGNDDAYVINFIKSKLNSESI